MATLQEQLQAYYDSQNKYLTDLKSQYQSDLAGGAEGGQGFFDSRRSQVNDINNQLGTLKSNYDPALAAINSGAIDPAQFNLMKGYLTGDATSRQAVEELMTSYNQNSAQDAKLLAARNAQETQMFGGVGLSLTDALSNQNGDIGQLGTFLKQQTSAEYDNNIKDLIKMQLGAQGLDESGANVELQSKAIADLSRQREGTLLNAALGGRAQINSLGREDLMGSLGYQQQSLRDAFGLQRQGITMNFQMQLEQMRAQLATQLSQYRQASGGLGSMFGALGGAGLGAFLGSFTGPGGTMAGATLGSNLGGQAGGFIR